MAFMWALGNCCICGRIFSFNPERTPSVRGFYDDNGFHLDHAGKREPVCLPCMTAGNEIRRRNGKKPFAIQPGAYQEDEF